MNRFLRPLRLGLTVALLGGCAHTGNLAEVPMPQAERLAQDTAAAMRVVWPAASTPLAVNEAEDEPFLSALVAELRKAGYAVEPVAPGAPDALSYVVDRPDANYYRVRIQVGERSLQRLYGTQGGALQPASAWTRQD
ncbi:hypothetical protein [Methylotetracoccus oryzae]|uniref:hypothetical protein n=1 Tax=Methylotetracoccus oryzae TaxID=1919059 RepID=UPI00111BA590|nr:hypothetical protein [Methylotetracoccus oryzae]